VRLDAWNTCSGISKGNGITADDLIVVDMLGNELDGRRDTRKSPWNLPGCRMNS
jgi:hypothetical protein